MSSPNISHCVYTLLCIVDLWGCIPLSRVNGPLSLCVWLSLFLAGSVQSEMSSVAGDTDTEGDAAAAGGGLHDILHTLR